MVLIQSWKFSSFFYSILCLTLHALSRLHSFFFLCHSHPSRPYMTLAPPPSISAYQRTTTPPVSRSPMAGRSRTWPRTSGLFFWPSLMSRNCCGWMPSSESRRTGRVRQPCGWEERDGGVALGWGGEDRGAGF